MSNDSVEETPSNDTVSSKDENTPDETHRLQPRLISFYEFGLRLQQATILHDYAMGWLDEDFDEDDAESDTEEETLEDDSTESDSDSIFSEAPEPFWTMFKESLERLRGALYGIDTSEGFRSVVGEELQEADDGWEYQKNKPKHERKYSELLSHLSRMHNLLIQWVDKYEEDKRDASWYRLGFGMPDGVESDGRWEWEHEAEINRLCEILNVNVSDLFPSSDAATSIDPFGSRNSYPKDLQNSWLRIDAGLFNLNLLVVNSLSKNQKPHLKEQNSNQKKTYFKIPPPSGWGYSIPVVDTLKLIAAAMTMDEETVKNKHVDGSIWIHREHYRRYSVYFPTPEQQSTVANKLKEIRNRMKQDETRRNTGDVSKTGEIET